MSTELVERLRAHVAELEAKLERESGDPRYAKQALDRETARALKFGARATAAEAKVARMGEALADVADASSGSFRDDEAKRALAAVNIRARSALQSEKDRESEDGR